MTTHSGRRRAGSEADQERKSENITRFWEEFLRKHAGRIKKADSTDADDGKRLDAKSLPNPLHLYTFLTGSHHYHFGYFQEPNDAIGTAMDRMVKRSLQHFTPGGTMLDVGCSMGGSTAILADHGFPVLGLDPCRACISFAEQNNNSRSNVAFAAMGFQDLLPSGRAAQPVIDNILLMEVLQYFPSLEALFNGCRELLRPNGVVVVNDVITIPSLPWEKVPFHRMGAIQAAAEASGFVMKDLAVITPKAAPTMDHLIGCMAKKRKSLLSCFLNSRPEIEREIEEQLCQWEQLKTGFANGDLAYQKAAFLYPRNS